MQRPAGHQVFNVTVPGWGIDQMYLAYRRYRDLLRPHVVVLVFLDEDVNRVVEAYRPGREPREADLHPSRWRVEVADVCGSPSECSAVERLVANSVLLRCARSGQVARLTTARAITARLFDALAAEMGRRGERLVVVRIPTRGEHGLVGRLVWRDGFAPSVRTTTPISQARAPRRA